MAGSAGDVLDVLRARRSIRDFKAGEIPDEDVRRILEVATAAPSPGNSQPWRFHVLRGEMKRKLVETLDGTAAIPARQRALVVKGMQIVPVAIVVENPVVRSRRAVPEDPDRSSKEHLDVASVATLLGTAAAVENLLLAIHAFGYGSVWMGLSAIRAAAKEVLDVSGEVVCVLPVGHPADVQNEYVNRTRKPLEEVTRFYG